MEPLQCAVVGFGMIGTEHVRILKGLTESNVVVICDTRPEVAATVPPGIRFTTELQDALDSPGLQAVWVCTPQHVHRMVVEAALARDLAVFCEKPFASTLEDADAMIDLSQGKTLAIGHTLRFDADYIGVKQAIETGRLGTPVHLAARWNAPDYEGRIISGRTTMPLEMAIHDLDVFRWLAGPIEAVFAEGTSISVVGPGPDAVAGTVRFESGAVGALDHNWIMASKSGMQSDHRLAVFGTEGSAYIELAITPARIFAGGPAFLNTKYRSDVNGVPFGALATEDQTFVAVVREGRSWPLTLQDARAALVAALAMDRSVTSGRRVLLSEIDPSPGG
jgi:predicted dehydrogenase